MSAHERERLSAWLDDELTAAQRAEVDAHLSACAECRARLAEMEAVDAMARERPAEAPAGYFDTFARRVRARLEAERPPAATARPGRKGWRWRPPVWTWAAAAALILAVVTPLTMMRLGGNGTPEALEPRATTPDEGRAASEAAAPETVAPEAAPAVVANRREKDAASLADEGRPAPKAAAPLAKGAPIAQGTAPLGESRAAARAAPEPELQEEAHDVMGFAPTPAPEEKAEAAPAAPAPPRRQEATGSTARPEADRFRAMSASETGERTAAAKRAPAAPVEDLGDLERAREDELSGQAEAFVRLARESPDDAAGWRELREAWRAFVADHPQGPRADEARVRTIEAGLEAWRAGGEEEDLARARGDARAYLARDDAQQTDRVRRALASVEGR